MNGINTQGENIADNGAFNMVYAAYQSYVLHEGVEPTLPDLKYSPNQLFWISAAQTWCGKSRPEFDEYYYLTDEHAPLRYRIIGAFSNNYDFSRDFHCPSGSKMNPINKCEIW